MLAATTVNEAATLGTRNTNQIYNSLKDSLEAQDIPKVIARLTKEYNLPASAQLQASLRYQKILSEARVKSKSSVPATRKLYYDPAKQAQHDQQQDSAPVQIASGNNKSALPDGATAKKDVGGTTFYQIKGQWVPALGDQ
jgi:hypothetical protein